MKSGCSDSIDSKLTILKLSYPKALILYLHTNYSPSPKNTISGFIMPFSTNRLNSNSETG